MKHQPVHFEEVDGSTWSEDELKTRLLDEAYRPFDLERGPLLRVSLFTRSAREHILLLVVHHIVIDFWSLAILLNELGVLYPAENAGVDQRLCPLSIYNTRTMSVGRPKSSRARKANGSGPTGRNNWPGRYPYSICRPTGRGPPLPTYRGASHDFTMDED